MKRIEFVKQYPIIHNRGKYVAKQAPGLSKDKCYEWTRQAVVYETQVTFRLMKKPDLPKSAFEGGALRLGFGIQQVLTMQWEINGGSKSCGTVTHTIREWFPVSNYEPITEVHRFGFAFIKECENKGPDSTLCRFVVTVKSVLSLVLAYKPASTAAYTAGDVKSGDAALLIDGGSTTSPGQGQGQGQRYALKNGQGGKTQPIMENPPEGSAAAEGEAAESTTYGYRVEIDHCKDYRQIDLRDVIPEKDIPCGVPLDERDKPRVGLWVGDDWIDKSGERGAGDGGGEQRRMIYMSDRVHLWRPRGVVIVRPRIDAIEEERGVEQ